MPTPVDDVDAIVVGETVFILVGETDDDVLGLVARLPPMVCSVAWSPSPPAANVVLCRVDTGAGAWFNIVNRPFCFFFGFASPFGAFVVLVIECSFVLWLG